MFEAFRILSVILKFVLIVALELVLAVFVYTYLATFDLQTFSRLVKISKDILDFLITRMEIFLPEITNSAYATLIGELDPKSMLLLLTGLVMGAFFRLFVWLISALRTRNRSHYNRLQFQKPRRIKRG
ncbi:MAG: hypothetical protein HRT83_03735 [Hyphomicrobiaceae bacterium]|nr:hypothetical protein [Hyphomicrobiaceae bacterium]